MSVRGLYAPAMGTTATRAVSTPTPHTPATSYHPLCALWKCGTHSIISDRSASHATSTSLVIGPHTRLT